MARKNKTVKKISSHARVLSKKSQNDIHCTKVRVFGVGGGGGNIVAEIAPQVPKIDFWAANTDAQALKRLSKPCHRFLFGQKLTGGLGCGGSARLGALAAEQAEEKISRLFRGVDFYIFVSCLGGGTGSGSIAPFAKLAKKAGSLSLGVFTLPFRFEGEKRMQIAKQALAKTVPLLSASVVFPNEKIFQILDKEVGFQSALSTINAMLAQSLKNLMDVLYSPGLINIDFADLRSILEGEGKFAYLASASAQEGNASGETSQNYAETALETLLSHPLNEYNPQGAERILFNISADRDLSIAEVQSMGRRISALNPQAKMIFGVSHPPKVKNSVILTLLATGRLGIMGRQKMGPPQPHHKKKKKAGMMQAKNQQALEKTSKEMEEKTRGEQLVRIKKETKKKQEKQKKQQLVKTEVPQERQNKTKIRKNALDLQKEIEIATKKQKEEERVWDIPAFLRRNAAP